MNNSGKKPVAIITGAASGIGKATALKFASNGFSISLVDINLSELNNFKKELVDADFEFLCIPGDLGDSDFISTIVKKTVAKWGRIDALINNAAWRTIETMRSMTLANWEKTLKVCLTAPAFLAKHAAAVMEEQNIPGAIVNISSVMSKRAGGNSPAYLASKGGIESLTYDLAALYGPKGIRVVAVNPGNIETNLSNVYTDESGNNISKKLIRNMNDNTPLRRSGGTEEIANAIYWLCSDQASFITGTSILVDGGFLHNFDNYKMKRLQFPDEF